MRPIAWAKRCPASDNEIIEIRQVQEMSDFPADDSAGGGRLYRTAGQIRHARVS